MATLLEKAENFVVELLNAELDKNYVYHNVAHTQRVVEKTNELLEQSTFSEEEKENLLLAAWFHDVGYIKGNENHEIESTEIASKFLVANEVGDAKIGVINAIILATKMDATPETEFDKIIRDADCSHLGSKSFSDYSELLRKEWELTLDKNVSDKEWMQENIEFLTHHHRFYTANASKLWEKQKGKNLAQLIKKRKKQVQEDSKLKQKKEELAFKKNKVDLPERGIETMFRVALRNHITLSDIADTKANILLSVNAIIISMIFSTLIPKLDNPSNDYLITPSIVFIGFTLASMILSILATRPNVTQGKFSKEDVANKKVNLIFFGNFHKMSLPEFEWAMDEMMKDRDYLYGSLTKDLYFLGLVLNRKYNLLRTTYTVFMIGIIVSAIAFVLAFYNQSKANEVVEVLASAL